MTNLRINPLILVFFIFPISFLTGPFLPDFLLVIISLIFIYLFFRDKLFSFGNQTFNKISLLFIFHIIISGVFSLDPYSSLIDFGGPIFYFRNFIFIIAMTYFFKSEKFVIPVISLSLFISILFVLIDSYYQSIFGSNLFGMTTKDQNRLTGIFGKEQILGHYLSYVFPIFISLYIFVIKKIDKPKQYFLFIFTLLVLVLSFLSGDRTGFLKLLLFVFSIGFIVKDLRKLFLGLILILGFISMLLINFNEKSKMRFDNTLTDISNNRTMLPISPGHEEIFYINYNLFLDFPLLGAGPQMFRVLCPKFPKYRLNNDGCTTHAHNYYFQILAELGILGLSFLIFFYLFLIKSFVVNLLKNREDYPLLLSNIHLIILYLPFISHFNFYNNWVNPTIALSISVFLFLQKQKT